MCGIAGFWNRNSSPADREILREMAECLVLRGPDGEGFFTQGPVGLAHRRLSIIDLSGGAQPIFNEDRTLAIVFNGEIFNYRELRTQLLQRRHQFRTQTDTEVILHLYEDSGVEAFSQLNGFFAIAIYDCAHKRLLLARDRFGVKPLYYADTPARFAFASEIRAVRRAVPDEGLSTSAIADYLALQYIPGTQTVHKHIKKLPPGTFLSVDQASGTIDISNWYKANCTKRINISYRDACVRLKELVFDAVQRRMIADVPLGVFLSGGLDSAVIAASALRCGHPLQCFSIGFDNAAYDERTDAVATAQWLQKNSSMPLKHHVRVVNPSNFDLLKQLVPHFGEPFADASMLPSFLLSQFTRETVTVALSGDGADEIFGGYERYLAIKYLQRLSLLPHSLTRACAGALPARGERSFSGRLKRFLQAAGLPLETQYFQLQTHQASDFMPMITSLPAPGPETLFGLFTPTAANPVERVMEADWHTYLPGDILVKSDVCSMAASLEVRPPFLDYRIMDFAASLPRSFKQSGQTRKRILSDAFRDLLPPDLPRRRKRGFGVPLGQWFRADWKEPLTQHLLENPALCGQSYMRHDGVERLLGEHLSGQADHTYPLFSLLMLALYLEDCSS